MIKAISFDLDHTLYNRNATWDNLFQKFVLFFSTEISLGYSEKQILNFLKIADRKATYEETSWNGMFQELKKNGIFSNAVDFKKFKHFIYEYFPEAMIPFSDTYTTLSWCKENKYHPSIITNGHKGLQDRKIASMGLDNYVEICLICDLDSGKGCKPNPDAFLKLTSRLGLLPEEILYVGDNPVNDIEGARNVGMKTAWLNVMDNWVPQIKPADYEISSLCELQQILIRTKTDK